MPKARTRPMTAEDVTDLHNKMDDMTHDMFARPIPRAKPSPASLGSNPKSAGLAEKSKAASAKPPRYPFRRRSDFYNLRFLEKVIFYSQSLLIPKSFSGEKQMVNKKGAWVGILIQWIITVAFATLFGLVFVGSIIDEFASRGFTPPGWVTFMVKVAFGFAGGAFGYMLAGGFRKPYPGEISNPL
jgi:hypothetical protein